VPVALVHLSDQAFLDVAIDDATEEQLRALEARIQGRMLSCAS
jgi:hypothetical protein